MLTHTHTYSGTLSTLSLQLQNKTKQQQQRQRHTRRQGWTYIGILWTFFLSCTMGESGPLAKSSLVTGTLIFSLPPSSIAEGVLVSRAVYVGEVTLFEGLDDFSRAFSLLM